MALYLLGFKTGRLEKRYFALDQDKLRQILSIGAPGSLNHAAMLVMNLVLNNSLAYYGALSVYGGSEALAEAGQAPVPTFWSPSQPLSWSGPLSGSWMRMQSLFYETAAQTEHA